MNAVLHQPQHQQLGKRKRLQAEEGSAAAGMASSSKAPVQGNLRAVLTRFDANAVGYPWNDPNANTEIQAKNRGAPHLVGYTISQCSRGGTNGQATHDANALMGEPSRHDLTSGDRSRGGAKKGVRADASKANFQCPKCGRFFYYAAPRAPCGHKHKHQRCGGKDQKAQVLVPYP
jgi:hypothetical protein